MNAEKAHYCVACKGNIPVGASVCSICKSYQHPWKNHLQYTAGIATLVVLVLSGSFWLYERISTVFFYRDDVRVVACNTLNSAIVVNRGDRSIYVSRLLLWMPGRSADWSAPNLEIDESLAPGQFARKDYPKPKLDNADFVRGLNNTDFEKLIARAANHDPCLELTLFGSSDSLLSDVRQMAGPTLNTFAVAGFLEYWGSKSDTATRIPILGLGVVRQDPRQNCK